MRNLLHITAAAALAFALPIAALADINSTATLTANMALNLDAGATGSSGGDILWTGSSITFQGNASGFNFGPGGFDTYTQSILSSVSSLYSKSAIPSASLSV